jgi:predicted GNAT superfamily acetyltransferase
MNIREITTLEGCRDVVGIQEQVWGADSEVVPASVLVVSIKRGGILLGAYEKDAMIGFVWSLPGWLPNGERTHWSHMLGVVPEARGARAGEQLKWAQRDAALAQGVALIEWTFDPLQALNAHLNLSRLGSVAPAFLADAYGPMFGPLHRGTPTDRLIAAWWINKPHVIRRRERTDPAVRGLSARSRDLQAAPAVLTVRDEGGWDVCGDVRTDLHDSRLLVPIPAKFNDMQASATGLALAWRRATRTVFQTYFGRGYVAVDFFLNRERGGGVYLLSRP